MIIDIDLMVSCVIYVISGTLQILMTIMFCINLYGSKRNKRLSSSIRRTVLLFAISCCLRMIFLMLHYIGLDINDMMHSSTIQHGDETNDLITPYLDEIATDILILISKIMLYWYLITRLKETYQDSAYYPSNIILNTLRIFMTLVIVIAVILCVLCIICILDELPVLPNNTTSTIFLVIVMSTLMVSHFVISALILYSFISGLYQLIISLKQTVEMNEMGVESLSDSNLFGGVDFIDIKKAKSTLKRSSKVISSKQEKLIEVITKTTLLSSIAIASTFIFLIFRIITLMLNENNLIALIYSVFGSFDATLDLLIIYLNFAFAKQWYSRICFKCDNWCLNKCTLYSERGIYNANKIKYIYGMDNIDDSYHAMI